MKNIFILGAFSGKNVGDEAILESTLINLSNTWGNETWFLIPTRDPKNLERYRKRYNILTTDVSLHFNIFKLFYNFIVLIKLLLMADIIIITASLFYEYKLFNFGQNPFVGLFPFLILAKLFRKRIGLYSAGIGPIYSLTGKRFIGFMLRRMDFLILREKNSAILAKSLGIDEEKIFVTADIALLTPKLDEKYINSMLKKEKISKSKRLGVNVNFYIDSFLSGNGKISKDYFINTLARSLDHMVEKQNIEIAFFVFCPWDNEITTELVNKMKRKDKTKIISFPKYNHLETASLLSKMDIFLGMRLHSLILSFAYNVPFISINYATKCHDFLDLVGEEDKEITFDNLNESRLINRLESVYKHRDSIKRIYEKKSRKFKRIVAGNGLILRRIYEKNK